jgi:aspartate aminotransferase
MPTLSPILGRFSPSPISHIFSAAQELKASGASIVDFSVGEPDFATPEHICEAARRAIDRGDTRYTPTDGSVALSSAIRAKFAEENGLAYSIDQLIAAMGAKPLLALAMQAMLTDGTEAILAAPCWPSHLGQIELAGARSILLGTSAPTGFKITAPQLELTITPRTRMVLLCSPSNPTGTVYSRAELAALAEVLLRHADIWVLSDDLYEHIVSDGATIAAVEPRLADRTLTVNGLSKGFAMTGWRIGFARGPRPWIDGIRQLATQAGVVCARSAKRLRLRPSWARRTSWPAGGSSTGAVATSHSEVSPRPIGSAPRGPRVRSICSRRAPAFTGWPRQMTT